MCDLISDVITCCVWSWDMGKIKASDKIMFENQKKRESVEIKKYFYIYLHVIDCLDIEFAACKGELMTQKALTSFAVSDAYH